MQSYNLVTSFALEAMAVLMCICCIVYLIKQIAKFAVYLYKIDEQVKQDLQHKAEKQSNETE